MKTEVDAAPASDPFARLQALNEQLEAARRDRARRGEEARAFGREVEQAKVELDHLARTAPDQFDGTGQPKAKSKAGQLKKKIEQAGTSRWPSILDGADQRIAEVERQVRDLLRENAEVIARADYERGLEAKRRLQSLASQMREAVGQMRASEPSLLAITTAVSGPLDGRDVEVNPRLGEVERLVELVDEIRPARIPTLTPYADEEPVIWKTADGGWMPVRSEPAAGWAEDQPERVERPS